VKEADVSDMFRKDSKSVCSSTNVLSLEPLSPPPNSSAMKTPENTEEDPNDPEPAGAYFLCKSNVTIGM
jgi:hypothetical protein